MGLRDEIQADIAEAFDADLADAVGPFVLTETVTGDYDPATGTTSTQEHKHYGRGVFGSFSQEEIDGQHIIATDIKLTVLQNELIDEIGDRADPGIGFLLINDGVLNSWFRYFFKTRDSYRVQGVMQDPARATWTIQLRKT
ncbi:MAG: hypothetical protein ACPHQ9_14420 [Marinobacter sp.]|uniref:hypothetical protein n=1 Tax=Marinobacter sp. TaxID=50741 RepID=UPI003C457EDF